MLMLSLLALPGATATQTATLIFRNIKRIKCYSEHPDAACTDHFCRQGASCCEPGRLDRQGIVSRAVMHSAKVIFLEIMISVWLATWSPARISGLTTLSARTRPVEPVVKRLH